MANKNDKKEATYLLKGSVEMNDRANILYSNSDEHYKKRNRGLDALYNSEFFKSSKNEKKIDDDLFWKESVVEIKKELVDRLKKRKDVAIKIPALLTKRAAKNAIRNIIKVKTEAEKIDFLNNQMTNAGIELLKEPRQAFRPVANLLDFTETNENLQMAYREQYLNTPYALQHTIYKDVNFVRPFLRPFVIDKIKSQLGIDSVYKIGGIFYEQDSEASKKLSKHSQLQNFIKENKTQLKNYGFIKKSSINFQDLNWHNAVGKADIVDVYLDKNGEITFYIIDTYDFNKDSNVPEVKAGRLLQNSGILVPYFMIYSVKINKEDVERLLK